jgi:heptosyltransferase-2/heptosyltransferase-3
MVLILPCCIGDVVLATATLAALRRGYPGAHLTWAVGGWSKGAVEHHNLLNDVLDTGTEALPVRSLGGLWRFVRQLRAGRFDLAVSLVRSPLMSLAVWLAGIPYRAGLDSAGRGFGYNIRTPVNPDQPRHEAEIYLDVARALRLDTTGCYANVPVREPEQAAVRDWLAHQGMVGAFMVVNPCGGRNPGMVMDSKRWPPEHFAALADRLSVLLGVGVVLLGGPGEHDRQIVAHVKTHMRVAALSAVGSLSFWQIAALAKLSRLYIGNDTGLTHLAAAAGGPTVMILGPSDPARYAPFTPRSLALWRPAAISQRGVVRGAPTDWDWARDGIGVAEAEARILAFLRADDASTAG